MKEQIKTWLEEGIIDVFLGYKTVEGHPIPYCFTKDNVDELEELVESQSRYPLEKVASHIYGAHPEIKIGLLARDCNQRALNVLYVWNQLDPESIKTIKLTCCPSNLKEHADCSYLEQNTVGRQKLEIGIDNNAALATIETMAQADLFEKWMYEFSKCIKCYGCRNICPVCFCKECSLEHQELIGTGSLPPEIPVFHLVRAVHMAGRCIDCGLCEDACPAGIPLRLLYRKVHEITQDLFGYRTGADQNQSPFNVLGDQVTLEPKPIQLDNEA